MTYETGVAQSLRMDFVLVPTSFDEATGRAMFKVEFDTRRYEWINYEGIRCLLDKFDNSLFTQDFLLIGLNRTVGLGVGYDPPTVDNSDQYVQSRLDMIEKQLNGATTLAAFVDNSETFLASLAVDEMEFVILSVDVVGSTRLATTLEPKTYARIMRTLLSEMSGIIPKFNGHVLTHTGDGLIAYFPAPSFITKNDLAVDCALTLRQLTYQGFNPLIKKRGFAPIDVRVGIDSGNAYIETIGDLGTKQHKDIIGAVVNLAAKIQAQASPGQICVGATTAKHLHTGWRSFLVPVTHYSNWSYQDKAGGVYQIYRVNIEPE